MSVPPGELLGYVAATLTTAAFVPQALLTWRSGDTRGISLTMYAAFTVGIGFWLLYGLWLSSWPMILSNVITFALAMTILQRKWRNRHADRATPAAVPTSSLSDGATPQSPPTDHQA